MRLLSPVWIICLLFISSPIRAQKPLTLASPDQSIVFTFQMKDNVPMYKATYKGQPILDYSALHLAFSETGPFDHPLQIGKVIYREGDETYELVVGKAKQVRNHYREMGIPLQEKTGLKRQIHLVVRAYNDGLAFRYEFPAQPNWSNYTLTAENSEFRLVGDPLVHTLMLPNFTTSHEGHYSHLPWSKVREDTLMDMPTLFEWNNGVFVAITEAALLDYAGMYLTKHKGVLTSALSPYPGQNDIKVKARLPHRSPWRVMLISNRIGALIESNLLTNLNEPCKIADVRWLKPGKTTFPWWNGNVLPDTINAPGNNFVTARYYIDFCAANHIDYHSVVEYGLHEWYTSDGSGFQPGPHTDVTRPVPGLDMQEICDYAHRKGVGIRVWVHWKALYPQLEAAFTQFEKWGISGMMVDFMDRDDQEMVNIQTEILQRAAAHHLHIQFHGAYKNTGLHRTYPNEFTREGTLNYEVNKWGPDGITPDQDLDIVFTRMLAGSTDYHLGGFRAVPPSQFRAQYTRPLMLGTRCHLLGMYVVLENYLGMVCDYPDAYVGQPGFDFIQQVPTVWEETKVVTAKIGEYVSIARRKNDDWFIGTINNHQARDLTLDLGFLPPGEFTATLYSDASNTETDPNQLTQTTKTVSRTDQLSIHLAAGGGQAVILRKKN